MHQLLQEMQSLERPAGMADIAPVHQPGMADIAPLLQPAITSGQSKLWFVFVHVSIVTKILNIEILI